MQVGGSVGYYAVNRGLWPECENLNLSTSARVSSSATYEGSAPAFSFGLGADYPLNFFELALSVDVQYLYLNFANAAWYNESGDEIVASVDGTEDGRVDLDFSGVRGKIEVKRYFS